MQIVTFLSDFGLGSGYVSQMKGVVSSFNPNINMIDICHQIPPQHVQAGAFVLATTVQYMPQGSIHVAVVDPGVGTSRRGIVIVTNKQIFIGPDNGLLIPSARKFGLFKVFEIDNESLFQHPVSNTFHGRDIFSSVAGHILTGISFDTIGQEIFDYVDLSFPQPIFSMDRIQAEILFVDDFGNLITNIEGNRFLQVCSDDSLLEIQTNDQSITSVFRRSYAFVENKELLVTIGSHGFVEISMNQASADSKLGLSIDDKVSLIFKNNEN